MKTIMKVASLLLVASLVISLMSSCVSSYGRGGYGQRPYNPGYGYGRRGYDHDHDRRARGRDYDYNRGYGNGGRDRY